MSGTEATAKLTPAKPPAGPEDPDTSIQLALLAAIVQSSDDAIVSKTLEGKILSWNAGATRVFGYQPEEVIGKPITIIIPPELYDEERRILAKVRSGERIDHFDTVRIAKDGRRLSISLTVSPVRDARGTIVAASKIARDVTERKRAEESLRESEARLTAQAEALTRLSELSTRLWRSPSLHEGLDEMLTAVIEVLGADKGDIQLLEDGGRVLRIISQRGFSGEFLEAFAGVTAEQDCGCGRTLRRGERVIIEDVERDELYAPYRTLARTAGYRSLVSSPIRGADGGCLGVVTAHFCGVHRPHTQELSRLDLYLRQAGDFIQRCRLDEILRRNEEKLRDADRRKNEFLALLAHELRNPLAPIRYALAAARSPGVTAEQQRQAAEVVERQVGHMSRLLDDLLDISRITHGALELKKAPVELHAVIEMAIETARPVIDSKHHQLSVRLPEKALALDADALRLAQVFANLLINAAKYTHPGGHIELEVDDQPNAASVTVRDDGIGISAEMMPRLFTLFAQADAGSKQEGLGVGLSLVRGLVALHGGTVEARSAGAGRGSEFTVRLPRGRSATPPDAGVPAASPGAAPPMRILVVDDSRDAADICATLLELSGHRVQTAYSGRRALEL
ncbi:MAG: PAS domain S-box protein, partial [Gammaproteobacteria bacterium]|nr:PAS domain S-box protein [Gammaproteobacteria bacterium]